MSHSTFAIVTHPLWLEPRHKSAPGGSHLASKLIEEENESMRRELVKLRKEREEIRGRVEKMLAQMESVAQEQAAAS